MIFNSEEQQRELFDKLVKLKIGGSMYYYEGRFQIHSSVDSKKQNTLFH